MPLSDQERKLLFSAPVTSEHDIKRSRGRKHLNKRVVILRDAVLPGEDREHHYLAEAPVSPGVTPLLLFIKGRDGSSEYRKVLALLPRRNINVSSLESTFCSAALRYISDGYKALITKFTAVDWLELLPAELVDGRHSSKSVPYWLREKLADFVDVAQAEGVSEHILAPIIELSLGRSAKDSGAVKWDVLHLDYGQLDPANDSNWYILEKWEDWQKQGLSSAECFTEFHQHHKRPGTQNAFNNRFYRLGLTVPLKTGAKPRREQNWRLKQSVKEKTTSP